LDISVLELCRYIEVSTTFEGFSEDEFKSIPESTRNYVSFTEKTLEFLSDLSLLLRRRY